MCFSSCGYSDDHFPKNGFTQILKVDVDVKMSPELLHVFIMTRLKIIEACGYTVVKHRKTTTEKGYHFWFRTLEPMTDSEACALQFLLGDDQVRARFNFLRNEAGAFKQFNALFNKKLKLKGGEV